MDLLHRSMKRRVNFTYKGNVETQMDKLALQSSKSWSQFFKNDYSYIIEKIYTMQDYPKWNDVPFRDKPKAKLVIALNKFVYDKINGRTE